jgi:hypothetical protein
MAVPNARPEASPQPPSEVSSQVPIDRCAARIETAPPALSLTRYAPAAVLIAVLLADSNRHTDPDLWGHLRFGQVFITERHLLHRDVYSYSAAGHLWRDHEWLAEVVMAAVYNAAGAAGLKLWKFACTATALLLVADTEASTGAPPAIQLAILFAAGCGFLLQAQLRPQMFSFVLLGALLALLARDNYRRGARLWLAVPLMALWANLHGGFFIGIATMALYSAVTALCDLASGAGCRRGMKLFLLTVTASAATLINPYGIGMWETVAHALRNPYTRNVVNDWQPLWWAMRAQWHSAPSGVVLYLAVIAMVVALAVALAAAPRADDLPLVAVAAMMTLAAFLSVRNMALAAMTVSGPLARHLALWASQRVGRSPRPAAQWRPASHFAILALACVMVLKGGLFSHRLVPDRAYPRATLAFMSAHGLHGNVLGEFGWGEYLIWHSAPDDKVFIDGRYDTVYPFEVIRDYLEFYFDEPGADEVLDSYPHDFVLIGLLAPARRLMERRQDWKLLYRDADALLYVRASAPAASLPGLPVTGAAQPGGFP